MKRAVFVLLLLPLAGCAYFDRTSMQEITVETPGAQNAVCYAYVNGLKHVINPPEIIHIARTDQRMKVDCMAPGNRRRTVHIKPAEDHKMFGNAFTGILPGMAWDHASGASYVFPEIIRVDFTGASLVPEALPAHNSADIRQPETYDLEEFTPGAMRLNEDKGAPPAALKPRMRNPVPLSVPAEPDTASVPGKGDLMDVLPSYPGD